MGWIVVLLCVVLFVVLTRKSVDAETTRNLKRLAKVLALFVAGLFALLIISYIGGH